MFSPIWPPAEPPPPPPDNGKPKPWVVTFVGLWGLFNHIHFTTEEEARAEAEKLRREGYHDAYVSRV